MLLVSRVTVRQLRVIYIYVHMGVYVRLLYMSFVSRVTVGKPRVIYIYVHMGVYICIYVCI